MHKSDGPPAEAEITHALPSATEALAQAAELATQDPRLTAILDSAPGFPRALFDYAVKLMREGADACAITALRCALAWAPADANLWTHLGLAYDRLEAPDDARLALERSVALDPRGADAWLLLGGALKKQGRLDAAVAAYEMVLQMLPESALAWQCLGVVRQEQKQDARAVDCFERCVKFGGANAPMLANIGKLYYQLGKLREACAAYGRAVQLDPHHAIYGHVHRRVRFAVDVLDGLPVKRAAKNFEDSQPPVADPEADDLSDVFGHAFDLLAGYGHTEAAQRVALKRVELWPEDGAARYMLQAINGAAITRSPPEFVAQHFDAFAASFDTQLVEVLQYNLPKKLCAAVFQCAQELALPMPEHALDAGCGTGLCAPILRTRVKRLTGVDLSAKMLQQAARRNLYDVLVCADIIAFLNAQPAAFDLLVAADVLIYIGDLADLFAAAGSALRPGALLAVSTETAHPKEAAAAAGYSIRPSGRFAHADAYVIEQAAPCFVMHGAIPTTVRLDAGRDLPGSMFVFQRR